MPAEPNPKRTIAFVDGQNLYHNARQAFGYTFPNYDVWKLAQVVCSSRGWSLNRVQFYTGIPSLADDPFWHSFWTKKLAALGRRQSVKVYTRPLVYRSKVIEVPGFGEHAFSVGEEKGIDVRLALDVLHAAHHNEFDVALLFSQDQDLSELVTLLRLVSATQNRWIKVASAFPVSAASTNKRGIKDTDWCPIEQATYDTCIDHRDYR